MHPSNNGLPTPLTTMGDLLAEGDTTETPIKGFFGTNCGNKSLLTVLKMHEFKSMSEVPNDIERHGDTVAQRKLDPAHASKLAVYILKGLVATAVEVRRAKGAEPSADLEDIGRQLGRQPYVGLQPLVVNLRNCQPHGSDLRGQRMQAGDGETACFKVFLSQRHLLWVIDGQHRRAAMDLVFTFLEHIRSHGEYPKKTLFGRAGGKCSAEERLAWEECYAAGKQYATVTVEIHLGLTPDQERQLFHDLNNLGKKVEASLALQFDSSNPVNLFIKDRLIGELAIDVVERDVSDWQNDAGALARKDLVAVNAILFLNKTNIAGATPALVDSKQNIAFRFWQAVREIDGFGEQHSKQRTVAAQPVVLKALAKLHYDFCFSPRRDISKTDEYETALLDGIRGGIDFGHTNPMWQYYSLSENQRIERGLTGLGEYLPTDEDAVNRDLGALQAGFMRFGAKHNDIYPILGDMIRWTLKLPSRR
jgi:hypothetical protein